MKICMVGTGYVGLVSGTCFSEMGHEVICVDVNQDKINKLNQGIIPIYEPGLEEMVLRNKESGRLSFTTELADAVKESLFVFIAVGTPPDEDGSADLTHVLNVAKSVGQIMDKYKIIVNKSTVPVGTAELVRQAVRGQLSSRGKNNLEFDVVSNPEFLKEGDAINDFMRPDRIVVGTDNPRTEELMKEVYGPFLRNGHPMIAMDLKSSELTKYAANAMLATRISFMNELANLCDVTGADIENIRKGIGSDKRIGMPFLYAGIGYGGSCFPKDVQAITKTMNKNGIPALIMNAVETVNHEQRNHFAEKIIRRFGKKLDNMTFAVWGLAFKPKTDDVRESPAISIVKKLYELGANFRVFDPEAMETSKTQLPKDKIHFAKDMYDAVKGADTLLLMTEWNEFRSPDFEKLGSSLKNKIIFDGRNQYNPKRLKAEGWEYFCIGRSF